MATDLSLCLEALASTLVLASTQALTVPESLIVSCSLACFGIMARESGGVAGHLLRRSLCQILSLYKALVT